MTKHVEPEQTNETTELTTNEMERVSGGLQFIFKLVAVNSWAHDDDAPPPPPPQK
jgi:hypothetical protein